jgi:hypothetical protein
VTTVGDKTFDNSLTDGKELLESLRSTARR